MNGTIFQRFTRGQHGSELKYAISFCVNLRNVLHCVTNRKNHCQVIQPVIIRFSKSVSKDLLALLCYLLSANCGTTLHTHVDNCRRCLL